MKIGYVRAARIVDQLEEKGIVGPAQGSNPREVLVGADELERLLRPSRSAPV
jgi:S-DNA-T family DNA segregation ATPase FtsK/SpoIIIE